VPPMALPERLPQEPLYLPLKDDAGTDSLKPPLRAQAPFSSREGVHYPSRFIFVIARGLIP
jgi:hypothetical protein